MYLKVNYQKFLRDIDVGKTRFQKLWYCGDQIAHMFINSFQKQLAPHNKTMGLSTSMMGNYDVEFVGGVNKMLKVKILNKDDLPPHWAAINWGSAGMPFIKDGKP